VWSGHYDAITHSPSRPLAAVQSMDFDLMSSNFPVVMPHFHRSEPLDRLAMRLSSFVQLDQREARDLRRVMAVGVLEAHEDVLKGAASDVVVLLSGLACRYKSMSDGRRQITGLIAPGDICHYGFLTGNAVTSQSISLAVSQVGRISIADFTVLCEQHPQVMRATLRAAAIDAAMAEERIVTLGQRASPERVAHLFCELIYRLRVVGLVSPDNDFDFPITQAEIADTLGISTVHVNRTLQALRREGLIAMRQGKVTINDLPGLVDVAGFSPAYLKPGPEIEPDKSGIVQQRQSGYP